VAKRPDTIGPFEVLDELGRGGMGVVYRARREGLAREFAVKVMQAGPHLRDDAIERFRREAKVASLLADHAGIVGVHEVGEAPGCVWFAMDLVPGDSLEALIDEGDLTAERAARLLEQAARSVHVAHTRGVLHRDLKPGNILVTPDDDTRIVDFGLATIHGPDSDLAKLTRTGEVMGTPAYMSPEQAQGEPLDARTDVYGLGATLYEALVGSPVFSGTSPAHVISKVVRQDPDRPRKTDPRIPADLETITLRCLEKEPAHRYVTAQALADDLGRFLRGEAIHARPVSILEKLGKKIRRNPAPWAVGTVASVLLIALVTWMGWQSALASTKREASLRTAELLLNTDPERALGICDSLEKQGVDPAVLAPLRATAAERTGALLQSRLTLRVELPMASARTSQRRVAELTERLATTVAGVERTALELERERHYSVARANYLSVLGLLGDHPAQPERNEAVEALAAMAWARLQEAELAFDMRTAARFADQLRSVAAERYAKELRGDGTLTIDTIPSGVAVVINGMDPEAKGAAGERPLGTTPLRDVVLPKGEYRLIFRAPGRAEVVLPIFVERLGRVAPPPVVLPTRDQIGDGFSWIPPGPAVLGGDPQAAGAGPLRRVQMHGYCLSQFEVTVEDWEDYLVKLVKSGVPVAEVQKRCPRSAPASGYYWELSERGMSVRMKLQPRWPILGISWDDAVAYCAWRSTREGRTVRLPTADEWERAARGASGRRFPWGNTFDWAYCNGGRNPMHAGKPGPLDVWAVRADTSPHLVADLAGSVMEWVADAADSGARGLRGGAWGQLDANQFRVAGQGWAPAHSVSNLIGFRVAAELKP
jgi:formylglycine-generating enzyme required for sulfatase activity/predicted Ser/Thr protein kinase